MTHGWRKKSKLHEKLWAMGLCEKEADAIAELQDHALGIAVAEWMARDHAREVFEIAKRLAKAEQVT